jgi:hypothetical protein
MLILPCLQLFTNQKENFQDENDLTIFTILSFIISLIISLYAAFLSYTCSSQSDKPTQIIFAIFAYLWGFVYLIYYFFFNFLSGRCI